MHSPMPAGALLSKFVFDKYEDSFKGIITFKNVINVDELNPCYTLPYMELFIGDWEEFHVDYSDHKATHTPRDGWAWDDAHRSSINLSNCVRQLLLAFIEDFTATECWDFSIFDKFIIADYAHSPDTYVIPMEISADWKKLTHWDQLEHVGK